MSLNDLEVRRVKNAAEAFMALRRPPPEVRDQIDIGFRMAGQSVELFPRDRAPADSSNKPEIASA